MKKIIGVNFLHTHPSIEKGLGVNKNHVIVDREDFEQVINFFNQRPGLVDEIGKQMFGVDLTSGRDCTVRGAFKIQLSDAAVKEFIEDWNKVTKSGQFIAAQSGIITPDTGIDFVE